MTAKDAKFPLLSKPRVTHDIPAPETNVGFQFYLTVQTGATMPCSFPLSRIEINFDNEKKRLRLEIMFAI